MKIKTIKNFFIISLIHLIMFWLIFQVIIGSSYYDNGYKIGFKKGMKIGYIKAAIKILSTKIDKISSMKFDTKIKLKLLRRFKLARLIRRNNYLIYRARKKIRGKRK